MPAKRNVKKENEGDGRTSSLVKRVRDATAAEKEATQALRIRPTAHLFALLAVIAESKGEFDRASDFRLLQAYLARDIVLWEELLHEFMSQQMYFKSVVCLQRMSALEKDKTRYRALQLQLADLLVGLGEVRRALNVLVPLWNGSRCRDFEVFALLSSLYFQLGKWASLQRLIESSVKYAFQVPASNATQPEVLPSTQISGETRGRACGDECSLITAFRPARVETCALFWHGGEGGARERSSYATHALLSSTTAVGLYTGVFLVACDVS